MSLSVMQSNPGANCESYREEINAAVSRVLDSHWYILGKEVTAFEQEFSRYVGVAHAIGVGSGTDALHVALRACGAGPGDLVFTVSHTAVATVAAIDLCGATPVFVDIDPQTFVIDPNRLEGAIQQAAKDHPNSRPKAVIPVHLYGHPADMPAIMTIAQQHNAYVIEDCAQSHGATIDGKQTGAWGHLAAFSFYPTKNLGALGDGGAIVSNDAELANQARLIREYGWKERYVSAIPGLNSRLDEMQAAILRVKLAHLDEDNQRRKDIAKLYDKHLPNSGLTLPTAQANVAHVYHQYVVRSAARDELKNYLRERNIGTLIHYPVPVHQQPAYTQFANGQPLPHTELAAQQVLSLPMYPELSQEQVVAVAQQIGAYHNS